MSNVEDVVPITERDQRPWVAYSRELLYDVLYGVYRSPLGEESQTDIRQDQYLAIWLGELRREVVDEHGSG